MVGKIVGALVGFAAFKNPFGLLVGALLGHMLYDRGKNLRERRDLFFEYVCVSVAKLAKADGVVSREEIDAVETLFRDYELDEDSRRRAIAAFRAAKNSSESAEDVARRFAADFADADFRHIYMLSLCKIAVSDGELSSAEINILENVADILSLDLSSYISYGRRGGYSSGGEGGAAGASSARSGGGYSSELEAAYGALGVSPSASDAEIKKAYREKCKELHPDVLKHKGLGDFAIKVLEAELSRVNDAYETIKKHRK